MQHVAVAPSSIVGDVLALLPSLNDAAWWQAVQQVWAAVELAQLALEAFLR